jgi:AraC-like DNA-binding protein
MMNSDKNISEIAYEVGFNDPNYFTRVFKKEFGKTRGGVRKEG